MKGDRFKKDVVAWCLYDWANSAFAVTVLAGFFPMLFRMFWDSGATVPLNTARLGMGDATAGIIVACLSPVLGAIADAGRRKKAFLVFFMVGGVLATGLLFSAGQGAWKTALVLFVLANIGFSCGNLFYDSLLVDVSEKKDMDSVSSLGYAAGYLGGGLLFLFNVLCVLYPSFFRISGATAAMRLSFPVVSLWWLAFSLPLIFLVKERRGMAPIHARAMVGQGFARLRATSKKILRSRLLLLFIVAFWLYMDGVYTFIMMAINFGMSIGIAPTFLALTLLVVQFVAFPAALGFGRLARVMGTGTAILTGIGIYLCVCIIGSFFLRTSTHFLILSCVVAVAMGGIQALSRSYFAKLVPADDAAEYFGFLNLISKFSVILGPMLVAFVTLLCHRAGVSDALSSRLGMSSVSLVFIAGGVLLFLAEKERRRNGLSA